MAAKPPPSSSSSNQPQPDPGSKKPGTTPKFPWLDETRLGTTTEYLLKKYLLLLATLVATVTYGAGLNLPGGSWLEDTPGGPVAGDSILRETNYRRYIVFYYFNAISFAASLLVGLLLLLLHQDGKGLGSWLVLQIVRVVMLVDLFCLMGAYGVGSSHDRFTTTCGSYLLASGIAAYAAIAFPAFIINKKNKKRQDPAGNPTDKQLEKLEILLVLAIFAATNAYVAGLNPPGGFWRSTEEGHHTAGDPVLQHLHPRRYRAFFFLNTTAFVASLLATMLIVSFDKLEEQFQRKIPASARKLALYGPVVVALLGLGGAYAFGSCRDSKHSTYVVGLLAAVAVASIVLQTVANRGESIKNFLKNGKPSSAETGNRTTGQLLLGKTREDIQLLAILAATIAYQAGVDPPGGVWAESSEGHKVGDPILLTTHPVRYKVFFYFNSAAMVASLVIMVMLQIERLVRRHALEAAMILDLFGLIGAYAAGSGRDTSTSIYTVALAGGVLIYVVIHIVFFTLDNTPPVDNSTPPVDRAEIKEKEDKLQKRRDVLLLLSVLGATLAYQAGLTPPGGFWEEDGKSGHRAGFPVILEKYPLRYRIFYYCNAASFMASVALIVLLMNQNLYRPGIRCYALYVCMVAGMFGLMGAYSAGSSLHLRTSIIVIALVCTLTIASFAVAIYARLIHINRDKKKKNATSNGQPHTTQAVSSVQEDATQEEAEKKKKEEEDKKKKNAEETKEEEAKKIKEDKKKQDGAVQHNNNQVGLSSIVIDAKSNGQPHTTQAVSLVQEEATQEEAEKKKEEEDKKKKEEEDKKKKEEEDKKKKEEQDMMYLMLVGILGASVTYLTGLKPPGGMWRDDGNGHSAGYPVLYDTNKHRYNVFFYSNSISFMASIAIIASLLSRMIISERKKIVHLWPIHTAMVLDMLALLGAYAAGSARKWGTSTKVVLLLIPILLIIWGVLFLCKEQDEQQDATSTEENKK